MEFLVDIRFPTVSLSAATGMRLNNYWMETNLSQGKHPLDFSGRDGNPRPYSLILIGLIG